MLLECLERSPGGLWVKGVRTQDAIEVFWKPRFRYERGVVTVFDFNGEIEREGPASRVKWGEEWRSAGVIELVDEMVVMSGLEHFEAFVNALTRHVVRLLVCGYGDSPGEVIGWFSDFSEREFVVEGNYIVVGEHGEFDGLTGARVLVERSHSGSLLGAIAIRESEFGFDLDDSKLFTSFVIAALPVQF